MQYKYDTEKLKWMDFTISKHSLQIQRRLENDTPSNPSRCCIHFPEQNGISHHTGNAAHLPAALIHASHHSYDAAFLHFSNAGQGSEGSPLRPFVHHFRQGRIDRLLNKLGRRQCCLKSAIGLHRCNCLCNLLHAVYCFAQGRRQPRLCVVLFLAHEHAANGCALRWGERVEDSCEHGLWQR